VVCWEAGVRGGACPEFRVTPAQVRFAVFLLKSNAEDLNALVAMHQQGIIKVSLDTPYTLNSEP